MMDKDYLYQIDIREWIERGLDADIMVPVSGNKIDKKYDIYLQSFLLPLNEVENDMENDTYNAHTLMPGITVYGSWEDDEKVYHRWGNDNGYEPLVIKREYNGVATDSIEIVEEFRLLFNLYFNSQKNEYIDVSNGEGITVVKMNDNGYVTIHKRYLKTYLAVKEKVLMIHIDSRCVSIDKSEKIKEDGLAYRNSENTIFYALNIGNTSTGLKRKNYSIIYAKNVVSGCSLCDSNIWPYNEEKTYVDFIIGIDENGKEIRHTCNPKELNNYFGANPTAPHYLTPVYFDSIFRVFPVMQSDIHLQRGNTVLIIDAKYYSHTTQSQFDKHTIHSNNLYQIFTYVKNRSYQFGEEKNTVSGMLLYAKTEEEIQPDNVYQMHGSQISVKTLDLNQPFAEIANQMDRIVESHFSGLTKTY